MDGNRDSTLPPSSWLFAEGRLLDTLLIESARAGASIHGGGLVNEITFIEYIASSIEIALSNTGLGNHIFSNYDLERREPILNPVNAAITSLSRQR